MAVDRKTLLEKTHTIALSETEDKTCPICFEDYLDNSSSELPRKLPCGHTLGTECLLLWASSQANSSSVNCPICTQPIIYASGVRYILYAIMEHEEEQLERARLQVHKMYNFVDKTLGSRPSFMIFLLLVSAAPALYFKNKLAMLPFVTLYVLMSESTKNRLATHRYRDLSKILLIAAFLVGTFLDNRLGEIIFYHAVFPFEDMLRELYVQHDTTIVVLTLGVVVALVDTHSSLGGMVVHAVKHCIVDCELSALVDTWGV